MKTATSILAFAAVISLAACDNKQNEEKMNLINNQTEGTVFPKGEKISNNNFSGTAWLHMLVTDQDTYDVQIGNVAFEPGVRNSWHSHPGGQILLVTAGTGYYQAKGQPARLLHEGDVVEIPPDVVHWHGASPDREFTHIAISTRAGLGPAKWMEPVTDVEYRAATTRQ